MNNSLVDGLPEPTDDEKLGTAANRPTRSMGAERSTGHTVGILVGLQRRHPWMLGDVVSSPTFQGSSHLDLKFPSKNGFEVILTVALLLLL